MFKFTAAVFLSLAAVAKADFACGDREGIFPDPDDCR